MKNKLTSNLILFTTAIIWGFAFVAQVLGSDAGVGGFTFNAIRFLIGALSLVPVVLIFERERLTEHSRKRLLLGSFLGGLMLFTASALQQYGASITGNPGLAGFMTALYTVLTPIAYFLIFKKKTSVNTWIGVLIAVIGLYMLCVTDGGSIRIGSGELLLLAGAVFWTAHIIVVDRFVADLSPIKYSLGQFTVCGLLSTVAALIFESAGFSLSTILDAKWSLLYCGILSVGVAYTLQAIGQKKSDPTYAAIILSTEAVFSAVGGVLWNLIAPEEYRVDQNITLIGYIGCALIFAGIVISQLDITKFKEKKKQ